MDERDVRLLKAISELGTGSPERLHDETGIPVSTIHYRLNNLREDGIIENDCYDLDLEALGLPITVILEVLTDHSGSHQAVAENVEAIEAVTQLFSTMGETDFVAIARLTDGDDVGRLIRDFETVDGVERTNSTYVIDELHDDPRALSSYSLDTLLAALTDD